MSECLFCKIVAGKIPAKLVAEDERAVVISDINPQAPTHVLVLPRKHIASLNELDDGDAALVGHLFVMAKKIAAEHGLVDGWRAVFNTGAHAGQTVFHIHLHVLGGRSLGWPPG
jgi:histidine triad (HIT) family protein